MSYGQPLALMTLPLYVGFSHIFQNKNKNIAKLEEKALEKSCLDSDVEYYRKMACPLNGVLWFSTGLLIDFKLSLPPSGQYAAFVVDGLRGLSFEVMRADNLPPRKNVFERAKEKVSDFIEALNRTPVPVPVRFDYCADLNKEIA
jgi:hypothetical protein